MFVDTALIPFTDNDRLLQAFLREKNEQFQRVQVSRSEARRRLDTGVGCSALRVGLLCCFMLFASGFRWGQVAKLEAAPEARHGAGCNGSQQTLFRT